MEQNDLSKFRVDKLNTTNYFLWSNMIEVYLRGRGLWGYVDGTTVAPAAGADDRAAHEQKCDQAISIILLSIQQECLAPVISMRNPQMIWTTLKDMFESSSQANFDALLVQYQQLTMHESENVMQYVNRVVEMENNITSAGHKLSGDDKKRVLLRGLRSEFSVISGVARATSKTVQETIGLLFIEEAQSAHCVPTDMKNESAFAIQKFKKHCTYCGKKGHEEKRCWLNPKGINYRPDRKKKSDRKTKENSYISFLAKINKNQATEKNSSKWHIDSGASAPLCCNENDFEEIKKEDNGSTVSIGDGTELSVMGVGKVKAISVVKG